MFVDEENEDLFDRLPDAILLTIFDKLQDAKSLCISSSLCKRFHFLTTQTHHISLTIPPQKKSPLIINTNKNQFIRLLNTLLLKPFQFVLRQVNKWNTQKNNRYKCCTCTYDSPAEHLTSFSEVKELEIRLPSEGDKKNNSDPLLKWKAEFGSQLRNCLIVGGTSLSLSLSSICSKVFEDVPVMQRGDDTLDSQRMTNEELKLRVVWILSTLIAASARYSLLEETIKEKRTINNVVILDDHGQGKCCMNGEQVEEMRRNTSVFSTKMPALKVKMWYVPELELPEEGCVMKGATLVVIKPVEEWSKADDGRDLVAKGFGFGGDGVKEKVFDEVAKELVKLERSYSLEMNSF